MNIKDSLKLLDEELLVSDKQVSVDRLILYDIVKNPELEEMGISENNIGFIDGKGNMYLVIVDDNNKDLSYTSILKTLVINGNIKEKDKTHLLNDGFSSAGLAIQRNGSSNQIAIANYCNPSLIDRFSDEIKELFKMCGKINKEYEFVFANIDNIKVKR